LARPVDGLPRSRPPILGRARQGASRARKARFRSSSCSMQSRVTIDARRSSLHPSVPSGRIGRTRYRTSEVESHTQIFRLGRKFHTKIIAMSSGIAAGKLV
jgi:hypothetical protein